MPLDVSKVIEQKNNSFSVQNRICIIVKCGIMTLLIGPSASYNIALYLIYVHTSESRHCCISSLIWEYLGPFGTRNAGSRPRFYCLCRSCHGLGVYHDWQWMIWLWSNIKVCWLQFDCEIEGPIARRDTWGHHPIDDDLLCIHINCGISRIYGYEIVYICCGYYFAIWEHKVGII